MTDAPKEIWIDNADHYVWPSAPPYDMNKGTTKYIRADVVDEMAFEISLDRKRINQKEFLRRVNISKARKGKS